jgi:ubiquinone/menaquinone biosynthesis C-methylase UbiE
MAESPNTIDTNKQHFNEVASTWEDDPKHVQLGQTVAQAIADAINLAHCESALEFGAGTGIVTAIIAPKVNRITALDPSSGMLSILRKKTSDLGLANISLVEGNMPGDIPSESFDLIYGSMALHHIEDARLALVSMAPHIKPGGSIAIADIDAGDGSFHNEAAGVAHHGFDRNELRQWLVTAGFGDISFQTISTIEHTNPNDGTSHTHQVFLMTARKL